MNHQCDHGIPYAQQCPRCASIVRGLEPAILPAHVGPTIESAERHYRIMHTQHPEFTLLFHVGEEYVIFGGPEIVRFRSDDLPERLRTLTTAGKRCAVCEPKI